MPPSLHLAPVLGIAVTLVSARAYAQDDWAHPAVDDAPAPAPAPRAPDLPDDGRYDTLVVVHVDAPEPVELQRQQAGGSWATVCSSPCDRPLAQHRSYRVAGDGVRASAAFSLREQSDRVALSVRPSSSAWFTTGIVSASVGGATVATGAFVSLVVAPLQGLASSLGSTQGSESSVSTAGVVTMVVGGVLIIAGIAAMAANASTAVTMPGGAAASGNSCTAIRF